MVQSVKSTIGPGRDDAVERMCELVKKTINLQEAVIRSMIHKEMDTGASKDAREKEVARRLDEWKDKFLPGFDPIFHPDA